VSGGTNTVEGGTTGGTLHVQSGGTGFEFTGTGTPNVTLNSDATNAGRMLLEGNLTVASTITGTATISNGGAAANSGFIDMSGDTRTFTVNDATPDIDLEISALLTNGGLTKEGTGTMRLTGDNTYDGVTDINAGTLLINASNAGAIGDVNINSGGTLGGTGTVGGATTLNSGGFLSAGDGGIGTLTFSDTGLNSLDISDSGLSGSLLFDLGAAGAGDLVDLSGGGGQLNIGNGLLDMDDFTFNNVGATSVTGTYTWKLFKVADGSTDFDFTTLGSNTTSTPFASIKSASLAISGNFIQLTMTVPEPSSITLLGLGLSSLLLRRRRS
jgi:autotransporter-associated beta strand protein